MSDDPEKLYALNISIQERMHAVQTAVATLMERGSYKSANPKHLRVGVNSALLESAALIELLKEKGLLTREEFLMKLNAMWGEEVETYRQEVADALGVPVENVHLA